MKPTTMLSSFLTLLTLTTASQATGPETLTRDVCIIGGGSSGTNTAIRLSQLNKTVTLIEQQPRLGGHVNTYVDPNSGKSFDYGVIVFDNTTVVTDYFASLNVPLGPADLAGGETISANFEDGNVVPSPPQNQTAIADALQRYATQLAKHPYLTNRFNLPSPVPEDLLITWGDFIAKYDLGAMAPLSFAYNQGVGNILDLPMLYFFKYFNLGEVNSFASGYLTTAAQNNQGLYNAAAARLGANALLSANVTSVVRDDKCVTVHVATPDGEKCIEAQKLVIAIPPTLANLSPFLDLDDTETGLFQQWNNSFYWDAVLSDTGIPDNVTLSNVDPAAPYAIPALPGIYSFGAAPVPGLKTGYYSSPTPISDAEVQQQMLDTIARLSDALGYPKGDPQFVGFNAHNPFELQVGVEAIRDGFYGRLEALQGRRRTWWTGAAWQAQDSSAIWAFNEAVVVPGLVGA